MAYVTIETLTWDIPKVASNGNNYKMLEVTGMKDGYNGGPAQPWRKQIPDFTSAYEMFRPFRPGDRVNVQQEQVGRNWNVVSVEPLSEDAPATSGQAKKAGSGSSSQAQVPATVQAQVPAADRNLQVISKALELAIQFTSIKCAHGIIKKSATEPVIKAQLLETTYGFAKLLEMYPKQAGKGSVVEPPPSAPPEEEATEQTDTEPPGDIPF